MDFLKQDVDRLLSYATKQEVRIHDRWLGIANLVFQLVILGYIVGFVFLYDEGYLEYEYAKGVTTAAVSSTSDVVVASSAKPNTRSFSAEELTYPHNESGGNLFVATKIEILEQTRGENVVCEDRGRKCQEESVEQDCATDLGAKCSANGFCEEPSWCPSLDGAVSEIYKTPTAKLQIWLRSVVQFHNLNKERIFSNDLERILPSPHPNANAFTVEDLLLLCTPPVRYEEISELGAAIEVQLKFSNCPVNGKSCKPQVSARRVDSLFDQSAIGFEYTYATPDPTTHNARRLYRMRGVRFYFRTVGTGEEISVTSIVFKISTGIALLSLAPLLADLLMLKCFVRSKKYEARKYEYSQDLGDYFAELEKLPQATNPLDGDDDAEDEEDLLWRKRMEEED